MLNLLLYDAQLGYTYYHGVEDGEGGAGERQVLPKVQGGSIQFEAHSLNVTHLKMCPSPS